MKFIFNNIDKEYVKSRPEFIGDIQPKYWFNNKLYTMLVKRQHSQKVIGQAQKSKMFNHFGEYFGYLLAEKSGIDACPVDLITVHDKKNKYSKTVNLYTACGSRKLLKPTQNISSGEIVVGAFEERYPEKYKEILMKDTAMPSLRKRMSIDADDNIDIVLASIISQTILFERKSGKVSEEQIKQDVKDNVKSALDMVVYDCMFGNNDRHSQNWSMYTDVETGKAKMYPLYDNERVLGLSTREADIKRTVASGDLENKTEQNLLSRMGISPVHTGVSYQIMLEYLANKYPEYVLPIIERITDNVTIQDVEELYNASEGITTRSKFSEELTDKDELPEEYRTYGMSLYSQRRAFARNLLERYKDEKTIVSTKKEEELIVI